MYQTLETGLEGLSFGYFYCLAYSEPCYPQPSFSSLVENLSNLTAIIALDFPGLGLDESSYLIFSEILYKLTNNEFNCEIQTPLNNI